jgi:hypothetical protein
MRDWNDRSLLIVLSMHRSGSSLSTGILQALGMSLGPFELLGANSGNPHGHFEAHVILELSRSVQMLAYGFPEDLPDSPETLSRFLETNGRWDESVEIPQELVDRGRSLIQTLIDSGRISGFKDPRTVLIWPFWQQVLSAFPGLRVLPVVLLRSPHEIAMSLFTRSKGEHDYKSCLEVTAVHLGRLGSIVDQWPVPVPRVRFGGAHYASDLAEAARQCGLIWDPEQSERIFDHSCVHYTPATIAHLAQRLYDSLSGAEGPLNSPPSNESILESDAFARERLYRERIVEARTALDHAREQLSETHRRLQEVERARQQVEGQLQRSQEQLSQAEARCEEQLTLLEESHRSSNETRQALQGSLEATRELLRLSGERLFAEQAHGEHLQARLDRYEIHPLLGPALRGRRQLVKVIDSLRTREAS